MMKKKRGVVSKFLSQGRQDPMIERVMMMKKKKREVSPASRMAAGRTR